MTNPNSSLAKILVGYYGTIQVLHLVAIGRATVILGQTDALGFPAPPPQGGWDEQARYFFVGVGAIDALNVLVALVFLYGFFRCTSWRGWVGTLTLTVSLYSAILFAFATPPTGAWAHRPIEYLVIVLAYLPVVVLMVFFAWWLVSGRIESDC
jgi:hypothetical protein